MNIGHRKIGPVCGFGAVADPGRRSASKYAICSITRGKKNVGKRSTSTAAREVDTPQKNMAMITGTRAKSVAMIAASVGLFPKGAMMNMDQLASDRPVRRVVASMSPKFVAVKSLTFQMTAMKIHAGR